MRVLVTDGDNRSALAITRSLGRAGHWVAVAERRTPSLAQTSRYCRARLTYPDPARDEAGFVAALQRHVTERGIDVLLPVSDIAALTVAGASDGFERICRVPMAPAAVLERAANKADVVQTAIRLGLPVPRTQFLAGPDDRLDDSLTWPVVIKPHRSRVRTAGGWRACSVGYARTKDELARELGSRGAHEYPLLLQERIVGPGLGVFVCYHRGERVAQFSHRRLREKPPSGGVSVLSESVAVCPRAGEFSDRLLREIGWHGVAMVEFKRDDRDGLPKLMEINGRFWGSLQLAIDAGVDFPRILLETLDPAAIRPAPAYRLGVKNRWFWGDVDSLLLRLRARSTSRSLTDAPGRLGAVLDFLKLWAPDLYYENPKLSDLRPWWYETRQWLKRA
jgi:predicted ATP-grasp superfamily ATP-dependent carboligase